MKTLYTKKRWSSTFKVFFIHFRFWSFSFTLLIFETILFKTCLNHRRIVEPMFLYAGSRTKDTRWRTAGRKEKNGGGRPEEARRPLPSRDWALRVLLNGWSQQTAHPLHSSGRSGPTSADGNVLSGVRGWRHGDAENHSPLVHIAAGPPSDVHRRQRSSAPETHENCSFCVRARWETSEWLKMS